MLNAFNSPYFNPASTGGHAARHDDDVHGADGPYANFNNGTTRRPTPSAGTSADSFRLTQLLGDNTARIIQLVWRVRW